MPLFPGVNIPGLQTPWDPDLVVDMKRAALLNDRTLLLLPAFRADYMLALAPEVLAAIQAPVAAGQPVFADILMDMEEPRAEGEVVVFEVRRVQVTMRVQSRDARTLPVELATMAIDVVARPFGTVASDRMDPAPLATGPAGWEAFDLLRLRFAPQTVDEAALKAMMVRRFEAEKSDPATAEPHFFALVAELPQDAASFAAFRAWQESRTGFVEGPLTVEVPANGFGGAWSGTPASPFHVSGGNNQFRQAMVDPRCHEQGTPSEMLALAEAAAPEAARARLACAALLTGQRAAIAFPDAYAAAAVRGPGDQDAGLSNLAFDKAPEAAQIIELGRLNGAVTLSVQMQVVGAEVRSAFEPLPVETGIAVARAIVDGADPAAAAQGVARNQVQQPKLVLNAVVSEVNLTGRGVQDQVVPLGLEAIRPYPLAQFVEAVARLEARTPINERDFTDVPLEGGGTTATTGPAPDQFDVLGVKLGMDPAEAEAIVRAHMDVGWTLTADRSQQPGAAAGPPPAWSSGRIFIDETNREFIVLYREPEAPKFGVIGLVRLVFVQPETVDGSVIGPALSERYGPPTSSRSMEESIATGFLWSWSTPADSGPCAFVRARPLSEIFGLDAADAPWAAPLAIHGLSLPDLRTMGNVDKYLSDPNVRREWLCPELLSVHASSLRPSFGMPPEWAHTLTTVLFDESRALNALRLVATAVGGQGAETGAAQPELEIDF
jgi:hypothetical protein